MQQIMKIEGMKPVEEIQITNREGKPFKAQQVRITNIAPLWGHEDADYKGF